jgi:hypothetical protein
MQKRFLQHSCGGQPEELVNAFSLRGNTRRITRFALCPLSKFTTSTNVSCESGATGFQL